MRDLTSLLDFKLYRIIIAIINVCMVAGLFDGFFRYNHGQLHWEFVIHLLLVFILTISLWIYPKNETTFMKVMIVIESMVYLYCLFIFYPDISSSFTLMCLLPGVSILFFLPSLFSLGLRGEVARTWARRINEAMAAIVAKHPARFGAFAVIPHDDMDSIAQQ